MILNFERLLPITNSSRFLADLIPSNKFCEIRLQSFPEGIAARRFLSEPGGFFGGAGLRAFCESLCQLSQHMDHRWSNKDRPSLFFLESCTDRFTVPRVNQGLMIGILFSQI